MLKTNAMFNRAKNFIGFLSNLRNRAWSRWETYPGPASEAQNQWHDEMLLMTQRRKIGGGLERVFIPSTNFAD